MGTAMRSVLATGGLRHGTTSKTVGHFATSLPIVAEELLVGTEGLLQTLRHH